MEGVADALEEVEGAEVAGADVLFVADVEVDEFDEEGGVGVDGGDEFAEGGLGEVCVGLGVSVGCY